MKTAVRDTSLHTYREEVRPSLGERQTVVFGTIGSEPMGLTNSEIASRLNWPINCVTPRVFELRKLGRVVETGKRTCRVTGRTAYAWIITRTTLF